MENKPEKYTPEARFACHCCGTNWIDPQVEALVHEIEKRIGAHLNVTSGYRCEKHNRKIGGSKTSSHLKGLAVDVACGASRLRYLVLNAAFAVGINRIGIYKSFIHMDIDRRKDPEVIWFEDMP